MNTVGTEEPPGFRRGSRPHAKSPLSKILPPSISHAKGVPAARAVLVPDGFGSREDPEYSAPKRRKPEDTSPNPNPRCLLRHLHLWHSKKFRKNRGARYRTQKLHQRHRRSGRIRPLLYNRVGRRETSHVPDPQFSNRRSTQRRRSPRVHGGLPRHAAGILRA